MSKLKILWWKIPIKWQGSTSWRRVEKKCMNKKKVCHKKEENKRKSFLGESNTEVKRKKRFFPVSVEEFSPKSFRVMSGVWWTHWMSKTRWWKIIKDKISELVNNKKYLISQQNIFWWTELKTKKRGKNCLLQKNKAKTSFLYFSWIKVSIKLSPDNPSSRSRRRFRRW